MSYLLIRPRPPPDHVLTPPSRQKPLVLRGGDRISVPVPVPDRPDPPPWYIARFNADFLLTADRAELDRAIAVFESVAVLQRLMHEVVAGPVGDDNPWRRGEWVRLAIGLVDGA